MKKKKNTNERKREKKISLMDSPCLHVRELITRVSIYIYILYIIYIYGSVAALNFIHYHSRDGIKCLQFLTMKYELTSVLIFIGRVVLSLRFV